MATKLSNKLRVEIQGKILATRSNLSHLKEKVNNGERSGIEVLLDKFWNADHTIVCEYVDQLGNRQIAKVAGTGMLNLIKAIDWWISERKHQTLSVSHGDTLTLSLDLKDGVDGIGSYRCMLVKSLLDACTKDDASAICFLDDIIGAGVLKWGDKHWEQTEGHTFYPNPANLVTTTSLMYGKTPEEAKELCKRLLKSGHILAYDRGITSPVVFAVETALDNFAKKTTAALDIKCFTDNLNEDQLKMISTANATEKTTVLVNAPGGTGKSYAISRLIVSAMEQGLQVLVCAPTGMASKTLGDFLHSVGVDQENMVCGCVATIDRVNALVEYTHQEIKADIVVMDEASMISTKHMRMLGLLKEFPKKLVMLGDLSQVKPIDIGCPFRDLWSHPNVEKITLTKNMRAQGSPVLLKELENARRGDGVIHNIIPFVGGVYRKDWEAYTQSPDNTSYDHLYASFEKFLDECVEKDIFIVTHTNSVADAIGDWYIAKHMMKHDAQVLLRNIVKSYFNCANKLSKPSFDRKGLRVYWSAERHGNGKDPKVYRGYSGVCNGDGSVTMDAVGQNGEQLKTVIPIEVCERKIKPWISRTVHKAQGQSYDKVMYLVKGAWRYDAELHYTAHSRAKISANIVSFCGGRKDIKLTESPKRVTVLGSLIARGSTNA